MELVTSNAGIVRQELEPFVVSNGYELIVHDLGDIGIKLELMYGDEAAAIIIEPTLISGFIEWLSNLISIDFRLLPAGTKAALDRCMKKQAACRGDKDKLRMLRTILKKGILKG